MGLDGSAMEGRTMRSCSNDNELSRAITSRSSAHKSSDWRVLAEFWQGPAPEPALQQRVEKKTDEWPHALTQKIIPCAGK